MKEEPQIAILESKIGFQKLMILKRYVEKIDIPGDEHLEYMTGGEYKSKNKSREFNLIGRIPFMGTKCLLFREK